MRKIILSLILLLIVLMIAGCQKSLPAYDIAYDVCRTDEDCKEGQVCDTENYCEADPSCKPGLACPQVCWGRCVDHSTEPTNIEMSCCSSCTAHYNEADGELCSNQNYSDGNIKRHCYLIFEDEKFTIDFCKELIK